MCADGFSGDDCAYGCLKDCNGHGHCHASTGRCDCFLSEAGQALYRGLACQHEVSPCDAMDCGAHGECSEMQHDGTTVATCECNHGYQGKKCTVNRWNFDETLVRSPSVPQSASDASSSIVVIVVIALVAGILGCLILWMKMRRQTDATSCNGISTTIPPSSNAPHADLDGEADLELINLNADVEQLEPDPFQNNITDHGNIYNKLALSDSSWHNMSSQEAPPPYSQESLPPPAEVTNTEFQ